MGLAFAPDWTVENVLNLRKFILTPTGKSFMQRARAVEAAGCVRSCKDAMHTTHSAARAAGFSDCLEWVESMAGHDMEKKLSGAPAVQGANYPTADDQEAGQPVAIRRAF